MNDTAKPNNMRIILIGAGVIILAWAAIQMPGWLDRWYDRLYENQLIVKTLADAKAADPFLEEDASLEKHIAYQNLMKQAGAHKTLDSYYKKFKEKNNDSPKSMALYSRVASDSFQREARLEKASRQYGDDPDVLAVRVEWLVDKGRVEDALELSGALPKTQWFSQYQTARALRSLGRYSEALDYYKDALQSSEAPLDVAIDCAKMICEEWRPDSGYDPFRRWDEERISLEPLAHAYRAWARNDPIEAVAEWMNDLTFHDETALALFARVSMSQGDMERAAAFLDKASSRGKPLPELAVYQGLLALNSNDKSRADALLSADAVDERIDDPAGYHARMGHLLWLEGQMEYALPHLIAAGGEIPSIPGLLAQAALAQMKRSNCAEAKALIARMNGALPESNDLLVELGDGLVECGAAQDAIELYATTLDRDYENMAARDKLAEVYIGRNEKIMAISLYDSYLKSHPDSGHCYAKVILIHHKLGSPDRAKVLLDYILENRGKMNDMNEVDAAAKIIKGE